MHKRHGASYRSQFYERTSLEYHRASNWFFIQEKHIYSQIFIINFKNNSTATKTDLTLKL